MGERGKVAVRKQVRRKDMAKYFANLEPCLIGMEACGSAHHWSRKLGSFGHNEANGAAIREAVCEDQQERRGGCGSDLRSSEEAEHAIRSGEDGRAASDPVGTQGETGVREGQNSAGQPD